MKKRIAGLALAVLLACVLSLTYAAEKKSSSAGAKKPNATAKKRPGKESGSSMDGVPRRVYFEQGIFEVTAIYDPLQNKTGMLKTYLAVTGPNISKESIRIILRNCAQIAAKSGAEAYKATQGEMSMRATAAVATFKGAIYACLSTRGIADEIINSMEPNLSTRMNWVKGLRARLDVDLTNRALYEQFNSALRANGIPEDVVNSIDRIYRLTNVGKEIKIDFLVNLRPPKLPGLHTPTAKEVSRLFKNTAERLAKQGFPIWMGVAGPMRVPDTVRKEVEGVVNASAASLQECLQKPEKCAVKPVEKCMVYPSKCVVPTWIPKVELPPAPRELPCPVDPSKCRL